MCEDIFRESTQNEKDSVITYANFSCMFCLGQPCIKLAMFMNPKNRAPSSEPW
jgi:hypothetical protein